MCVTVNVIIQVAVAAVRNCNTSVRMLVYSSRNGSSVEKIGRAVFLKWENQWPMVISIADYSVVQVEPKWVLQGKNTGRKKIRVKYFSFQGGDLLPLLAKLAYTNI
jgi:hypothetical protein